VIGVGRLPARSTSSGSRAKSRDRRFPPLNPPRAGLRRTGRGHLSAEASAKVETRLLQFAWIWPGELAACLDQRSMARFSSLVLGPDRRSVLWKHPDGAGNAAPSASASRGNPVMQAVRRGKSGHLRAGFPARNVVAPVRWPQGRRPESLLLKPGRGGSSRRDGQCHRKDTALWRVRVKGKSERGEIHVHLHPHAHFRRARVKRWGKSPPRRQQCRWQGKPNPVQDKIGDWTARPTVPGMSHPPRLALRASEGGSRKGSERNGGQPGASQAQNPAYGPKTKPSPGLGRWDAARLDRHLDATGSLQRGIARCRCFPKAGRVRRPARHPNRMNRSATAGIRP
jgi:hypothetical protein